MIPLGSALDHEAAQRKASDPRVSAWVSANAGCGKTTVLSRRVIRLLLDGADPGRLLCLTFTKAAAAEMATRVFGKLAEWTQVPDATLIRDIETMEGEPPDRARLSRARRLFARAIETPGGFKVQTIHAFCESLLQRFPIEANIAGHFEVLDELAAGLLLAEARRRVVAEAGRKDGRLAPALAQLLSAVSDVTLEEALDEAARRRDAFGDWIRGHRGLDSALSAVAGMLGVDGIDEERVFADLWPSPNFPASLLDRLADLCGRSGPSDGKLAAKLRAARSASAPAERWEFWSEVFLTDKAQPRVFKSWVTKTVCAAFSDLEDRFSAEVARLLELRERRAAARAVQATRALSSLADAVLAEYEAMKAARGVLDFDDLIVKAADLLSRSDVAQWVLYKLDGGIDHVLVDEAQDTSPRQWAIVRAIADEFFSGQGARGGARTLFAVGDEKQSIYSFQGARPAAFAKERDYHRARALAAGLPFEPVPLGVSFRSTRDVLAAVDRVFGAESVRQGVVADPSDYTEHRARRAERGCVDLWPAFEPEEPVEPEHWAEPIDHKGPDAPPIRLAARIADTIARWCESGERLERDGGRAVRPGDVLVLVRKRDAFVDAMNRALKARAIPAAGQDRLRLTDHIVVQDLIALGRFALLPEDDLNLAALLKSPLIGLDEETLFALAYGRPGSLWDAVLVGRDSSAVRLCAERLSEWRRRADFARPFEFYSQVLGADGGRRAIAARFGAEADDVLDEFLSLALAQERGGTPSLEAFLAALAVSPPEIKRESEGVRDEVRVMTVHGAKGLEAPVVFLVCSGGAPVHDSHLPRLHEIPCGGGAALVWAPTAEHRPRAVADAIAAAKRERSCEYRRLLYVGMTRAADRLVVCGYRGKTEQKECWHALVKQALTAAEGVSEVHDPDTGAFFGWRFRAPGHAPLAGAAAPVRSEPAPSTPLPAWTAAPPAAGPAVRRLSPSAARPAGGEDARIVPPRDLDGQGDAPQAQRGRLVHGLLQILPDLSLAARRQAASAFLAREARGLPENRRDGLIDECLGALALPGLAAYLDGASRTEVPVIGEVAGPDGARWRVSGRVDRLTVRPDEVALLDYKSNEAAPAGLDEVPPEHLAQMALYDAVLREAFRPRRVRAALLYTSGPRLVELPPDRLAAALSAIVGPS